MNRCTRPSASRTSPSSRSTTSPSAARWTIPASRRSRPTACTWKGRSAGWICRDPMYGHGAPCPYRIRAWKVSIERYFADTWGDQVDGNLPLAQKREKDQAVWVRRDPVAQRVLDGRHVELERAGPVVNVGPIQLTLHSAVERHQTLARRLDRHPVRGRIVRRQRLQVEMIVKGPVEQRPVHVQQDGPDCGPVGGRIVGSAHEGIIPKGQL